tara:strand:+ start:1639 stop:2124 length:486 start_codon:yes stop_codon:yes gene_type:complete
MNENIKGLKIKMKAKHKRIFFIIIIMIFISTGSFLIISNLRDNIVFFYSPSEIFSKTPPENKKIRVGGMVETNSLKRNIKERGGKKIEEIFFKISDNETFIIIKFSGILPDLFREGQGVVAEGFFDIKNKIFNATNVLAKHDENYMPPEVEESLNMKGISK